MSYRRIWQEPFPEAAFVTTAFDDPNRQHFYNNEMTEYYLPLYQLNSAWPTEPEQRGGPVKRWNAAVPDIPLEAPETKYLLLPGEQGFMSWGTSLSAE